MLPYPADDEPSQEPRRTYEEGYFEGYHVGYDKGYEDGVKAALPQERPINPDKGPAVPKPIVEALTAQAGQPKPVDPTRFTYTNPLRRNGHGLKTPSAYSTDLISMVKRIMGIPDEQA